MAQQLRIQKQSFTRPPQSPANINRLHQYFESSSFLHQQQQLALFIKQLPLINMKEMTSLNPLIGALIRQNELIGQKCQQQVSLLKESYLKHDKLVRAAKEAKLDRDRLEREAIELRQEIDRVRGLSQSEIVRKEQQETQSRLLEAENTKINAQFKEAKEKIAKFEQFSAYLCSEQYKKCTEIVRHNQGLFPRYQAMEAHCQGQRRRNKYFSQIRNMVEQFGIRLIKIAQVVSPAVLAQQLAKQAGSMLDLIDQIIGPNSKASKKRRTEGSNEKLLESMSDYGGRGKNNTGFFEGMIRKLAQNVTQNNTTKETLAHEIQQLRKNLIETKQYYEGVLKRLKQQVDQKQRQYRQQAHLKEQTFKFYEQELNKANRKTQQMTKLLDSSNQKYAMIKDELDKKTQNIRNLQSQIQKLTELEKQQIIRIKQEAHLMAEECNKIAELKIAQRDSIINQFNSRRRAQQTEHENEIAQLRAKIKAEQQSGEQKEVELMNTTKAHSALSHEYEGLLARSKNKQQEFNKLRQDTAFAQEKLDQKQKQIFDLKDTLNSLEHEKSLQASYIKELQAKIQAIGNKLKNMEAKVKAENNNKKQISAIKNSITEERQRAEQLESYCLSLKEDNHRLKGVVKEMKRQLEEVYTRLSELKQIESDRQRLEQEAQNSQRVKDNLQKQQEEIKFSLMRIEAENKKLLLQLKHYKNIVARIEALQQD